MKNHALLRCLLAVAILTEAILMQAQQPPRKGAQNVSTGVLSFTMKTIDGKDKPLSDYAGRVLLIVNTASECGFTPQYKGLEALYEKFKDRGLVVLAFPANNFGSQEPGTDREIKTFCSTKYQVTFDLFAKTSVKGADINPLYQFLTADTKFKGDIAWNFNKFLVNRAGEVVARYPSKVDPMDDGLLRDVEMCLDQKK